MSTDRYDFLKQTGEDEMMKDTHEVVRDPSNPRIAIIRTSDRITFKNCRRKWGWSSHLRHNLGPIQHADPLWFGTGFHFALEDFHGWNRFGHPVKAFEAWYKASLSHYENRVPEDHESLKELGIGMLNHYIIWLQQRKNSLLKTYWFNGEPQVEVNFKFLIPGDWTRFGYDEVYYSGTIDRMCIDEDELLWPVDYKTAKAIQVLHFLTDPQVGAYMWAAPHIYDKPIGGFLYQQHLKSIPNPGRILKNGGVSIDQQQLTTYYYYRETLIETYGSVERSPEKNQDFLSQLMREETETQDRFVRIDKIYRNERSGQSEGAQILMELEDMLNPDLPLYPNPTRDCANFCSFLSPCVTMNDGGDWKHELNMTTIPREKKYDGWREKLIWPGDEPETPNSDWLDV